MRVSRTRWAIPVSSAAAVAVVVAGTMGVTGNWPLGHHGPRLIGGSAAADAVDERANAVYESFGGTQAQRNSSGVVQAWHLNGAMDACMETHGFPEWDWSATRNIAPRTNALDISLFFGKPPAHAYSNALMDMSEDSRAEQSAMDKKISDKELGSALACGDATPEESDDEVEQASTPAGVAKLRDQWWSMLASLDERYGDVHDYDDCFIDGATSLPVTFTDGDSWKGELPKMAPRGSHIPRSPEDPLAQKDAWTTFLSRESALESVDWACRRATYEEHLADVDVAIAGFASEHAAEIEKAQTAWLSVESEARRLGYHGQPGRIG